MENTSPDKTMLEDDEQDLINCDNYHYNQSVESPPMMGHACASIVPNLVTDNNSSLEDSLLCSNTNNNPSE